MNIISKIILGLILFATLYIVLKPTTPNLIVYTVADSEINLYVDTVEYYRHKEINFLEKCKQMKWDGRHISRSVGVAVRIFDTEYVSGFTWQDKIICCFVFWVVGMWSIYMIERLISGFDSDIRDRLV